MRWKPSLAATFLGLVAASITTAAGAFDFGVSSAVSSGNLSVYLVRGADAATASLTLEQGLAGGQLKIHETEKLPIMVENLSGHSVFIQAGDMLIGGVQDQVALYDTVIGPHSGRVPIETLCVDPFRSTARTGDDAKLFAKAGGLIPSRLATLALLADPASNGAVRKLRQSAVWWSIDSLRGELSQRLGHMPETPRRVQWDERESDDIWARAFQQQRRSQWKTSLPLALEDPGLARAERPYLDALLAAGQRNGVIGAVFAVNGRVEGAEVYRSGALFRAMWPKLLRVYAVRALAAGTRDHAPAPSANDVTAFLDVADAGLPRTDTGSQALGIRESGDVIAAETTGPNGTWIHRSYVLKLAVAEAALSPEAAFVAALATGQIEGYPVTSLDTHAPILPQSSAPQDAPRAFSQDTTWRLALPVSTQRAPNGLREPASANDQASAVTRLTGEVLLVSAAAIFILLLLWRMRLPPKIASWSRSAVARLGCAAATLASGLRELVARARIARARVDCAVETQADTTPATALPRSIARLADRRRQRRSRSMPSGNVAPRTPVGGRPISDLAA